jgi:hypothetical protein
MFQSLVDPQAAINRFLGENNDNPEPLYGPPIPTT